MGNDDVLYDDIEIRSIHNSEIFRIVLAVISGLFTFSVVFILLYKYKILVEKRDFVHYILCIAISDTVLCFFYAWGFPNPGIICSIQSFSTSFAARSSWLYTDVLVMQLCYLVVYKRHFLNHKHMHFIVWSLNIILEFLPFSTRTYYGLSDSGNISTGICDFYTKGTSNDDDDLVNEWNDATFNGWLYLSFILILSCSLFIVLYTRNMAARNPLSASLLNTAAFSDAWKTIILYPIALLVAYIPAQIYVLYYNQYSKTAKIGIIANYFVALNSCYGLFLSIIFYIKTESAINEWKILFRCNKLDPIDVNDIEFRSTSNDLPKALEETMSNK